MITGSLFRHTHKRILSLFRYKHKDTHWSVLKKKKFPIDKALDYFDDFYEQVFANEWKSIRRALLSQQKYVAVLNNFSDLEHVTAELESKGALNMRTLFNLEKQYALERFNKNKKTNYVKKIQALPDCEPATERIVENEASEIKDFSLKASLKDAEFDYSRIVDRKDMLSTALLHEFVPATEIKGKEDWVPPSQHYKYYNQDSFPIQIEHEYDIHFPESLNVYCYEQANFSRFSHPKKGLTRVCHYYLMDGSSVLPVLALDIKPGNRVLDMCAGPGGKSLLALQTLYPECVICNDVSHSRLNRISDVLHEYFYDLDERWLKPGRIKLTNSDGLEMIDDSYDRVLVDVPCTTDRHSVTENDNNIFKPSRIKERLKLPEMQADLLAHALKIVKIGGVVVYSTCTLSPVQNAGVVNMALKKLWEETKIEVVVKNLSSALSQAQSVFKFANQNLMKYGHLVVPNMEQNYGPAYFCKLQRIK